MGSRKDFSHGRDFFFRLDTIRTRRQTYFSLLPFFVIFLFIRAQINTKRLVFSLFVRSVFAGSFIFLNFGGVPKINLSLRS